MTIYIDKDSGAEFEVDYEWLKELSSLPKDYTVIRPVKVEPEPEWEVSLETYDNIGPLIYINIDNPVSEDQAQLIKACVQELMESLDTDMPRYSTQKLIAKIEQARQAMKGAE